MANNCRGIRLHPLFSVLTLGSLTLCLPAVAGAQGGQARPTAFHIIDRAEDCEEFQPAAIDVPGLSDDGADVILSILVLGDGVGRARANRIMELASRSYAPLKITWQYSYRRVRIKGDPSASGSNRETADAADMIQKAKNLVGGSRPAGTDIVYLLTDKDISDAIAGLADCIGGVRYPDHAFAVGEDFKDVEVWADMGTVQLSILDTATKVAVHEIGHLMGAHHHYANCAEGISAEDGQNSDLSPCSVMFNAVNFESLNFGVIEGAVVRGHADEFARP